MVFQDASVWVTEVLVLKVKKVKVQETEGLTQTDVSFCLEQLLYFFR